MRRAFKFPQAFRGVLVPAGSVVKVFEFLVPAGGVAFVERVGMTLPSSSCSFDWLVDGGRVEEGLIQYQIGSINLPREFNPPIVAQRSVVFYAHNGGTTDETFEVVCDGLYYVGGV